MSCDSGPDSDGYVYFIQDGDHVKIGTSIDPELRLRGLQTSSPRELVLLKVIAGGRREEQGWHRHWHHLRIEANGSSLFRN